MDRFAFCKKKNSFSNVRNRGGEFFKVGIKKRLQIRAVFQSYGRVVFCIDKLCGCLRLLCEIKRAASTFTVI